MFRNLKAELIRNDLTIKAFALLLGVSDKTARNKLEGRTEFTLPEIRKILSKFPECEWAYLFASDRRAS